MVSAFSLEICFLTTDFATLSGMGAVQTLNNR